MTARHLLLCLNEHTTHTGKCCVRKHDRFDPTDQTAETDRSKTGRNVGRVWFGSHPLRSDCESIGLIVTLIGLRTMAVVLTLVRLTKTSVASDLMKKADADWFVQNYNAVHFLKCM